MGKQKNRRIKLHLPSNRKLNSINNDFNLENNSSSSLPIEVKEDVFQGIDIASLLKTNSLKEDDVVSIRSNKSNKSVKDGKILPKKEKLKLRREMLMKKIDTVNQLRKELKMREKRKKLPIIGDTKPLLDNLPCLQSLIKTKSKDKIKIDNKIEKKNKAVYNSKKTQKKIIENISIYKKLLKNPTLVKKPFEAISEHLKAIVEQERKFVLKN